MKRTPIKRTSKNKHDSANLRRITPDLTGRAGGIWLGFKVPRGDPHSCGCQCEICGAYLPDVIGARAHINERKGPQDDTVENIIIACRECHNHDAFPDGGLRCGTVEALRIVKQRNAECGIVEDE